MGQRAERHKYLKKNLVVNTSTALSPPMRMVKKISCEIPFQAFNRRSDHIIVPRPPEAIVCRSAAQLSHAVRQPKQLAHSFSPSVLRYNNGPYRQPIAYRHLDDRHCLQFSLFTACMFVCLQARP